MRRVWLARLVSYPVGVLAWHRPEPCLTVVVKITYGLDRDGTLQPANAQLSLGRESDGQMRGTGAVEHADDFVPAKSRCDVLVVGHAHAAAPVREHTVRLRLGAPSHSTREAGEWSSHPPGPATTLSTEWSKTITVVSSTATKQFLLRDDHMRSTMVAALAPRSLRVPQWRTRRLARGYDFSSFNSAPADQQRPALLPGEWLELVGLLPGAPRRVVRLPSEEPAVYYVPSRDGHTAARAVPLRCDTLWVHADMSLCTLTWRGVIDAPLPPPLHGSGPKGAFLAVTGPGAVRDWPTVARTLDAVPWTRATTEQEVKAATFDKPSIGGPSPGVAALLDGLRETAELDSALLLSLAKPALPFQAPPPSEWPSVEEYAQLRAEVDQAADPGTVLGALGMSEARYGEINREWTRRCMADSELASRLDRAMTSARLKLRRVHGDSER